MTDRLSGADSLNVLMISLGDDVLTGGGDTQQRHLEYAEAIGHLHMVVYSPRSHNLSPTQLSDHLTVYPTRSRSQMSFIFDAIQIGDQVCGHHPIDLITTQDPFSTGLVGVSLKGKHNIPLQIQNHSSFFDNPYWLAERPLRHGVFNMLGRWTLRRADTCRVVNTAEKMTYIQAGIMEERIQVIPVPTRLERFTGAPSPERVQALREKFRIPEPAPILLWVGNPARVKRVDLLLDAFQRVKSQHPDTHLILVGVFSSAKQLTKQADKIGSIHFAGKISHEDLPDYYHLATMYVHSSAYEGFGLVLAEAAACRLPIVSTRTAGAEEIIIESKTGLLSKIDSPSDLAEKIIRLLNDPGKATQMGAAGRRSVLKRFDRERIFQAIIGSWVDTAKAES